MPTANLPAWELLQRSLRRLKRFRELDAPAEVIEKEVSMAKRFRHVMGEAPESWPADLIGLADELGLRATPESTSVAANVRKAAELYRLVARIAEELKAAGGIDALHVTAAEGTVMLNGAARTAEAKARASEIASRLAPHARIENRIKHVPGR